MARLGERGGLAVRVFLALCGALVGACASIGGVQEFAPGQVWRLKDARFATASVTIEATESRGARNIVHISVSGLPGPPTNLPLFSALRRDGASIPEGEDIQFVASGLPDAEGEWSPLSVEFTIPNNGSITSVVVPHIVVYEDGLREAVSALESSGTPHHSMFDMNLKLWREIEERRPEMNDGGLSQPVSQQLEAVLRGATVLASDLRLAAGLGPPPPAVVGADEMPVHEPTLDKRCRELVSPEPLDSELVAELLKAGFSPEDIPNINVTLSNAVVTRSEKWGYVWRADVHDNNAPTNEGGGRSVCWRKTSDEQPAVTSYELPDVPH